VNLAATEDSSRKRRKLRAVDDEFDNISNSNCSAGSSDLDVGLCVPSRTDTGRPIRYVENESGDGTSLLYMSEYRPSGSSLPASAVVYSEVARAMTATEIFKVLTGKSIRKNACVVRPTGIDKNKTFIIDKKAIKRKDLTSDDNGAWVSKGMPSAYFFVDSEDSQFVVKKATVEKSGGQITQAFVSERCGNAWTKAEVPIDSVHKVTRYYCKCASNHLFHMETQKKPNMPAARTFVPRHPQ
jgi:hypothetical protein